MNSLPEGNMISGGGWYAVIEGYAHSNAERNEIQAPEGERAAIAGYSPVVAWERYHDENGQPAMRAWLSGRNLIASDQWEAVCRSHFINHFVAAKPENTKTFIWA